jgi:hypothetical protein
MGQRVMEEGLGTQWQGRGTLRLGSLQAFMVEYARKRVIEEIDPVLLEVNFYPVMCCCP